MTHTYHHAQSSVLSRTQCGMDAPQVRVNADVSGGLPAFTIVGLPETVVKESKVRVRAAIKNSGFDFPDGRITVNLLPADLPMEGGRFDLPIAIGILLATDQLPGRSIEGCELYGELSLSGEMRPIRGALVAALAANQVGNSVILPQANSQESCIVTGSRVATAAHLLEVAAHVKGTQPLTFVRGIAPKPATARYIDRNDVRGQPQAKRALEIAAAGEHSLLLIGPPGTGKSMLAQRLPGLLPEMSEAEALELAAVRAVAGLPLSTREWCLRPFRAPHHTASVVALVGGGAHIRPGEISLAHHGVLFLDELPEYDRRVLEVLREPLESGTITISRAAQRAEFPARVQFIAAMNPCPCGYLDDPQGRCRCTADQVQRYRQRISGPLLDRLDMHVEMPHVPPAEVMRPTSRDIELSAAVAACVQQARALQSQRQGCTNARLSTFEIEAFCRPTARALNLLERAATVMSASARAHHRVLKVARTIADLAGREDIDVEHVTEAISLRRLDRNRS